MLYALEFEAMHFVTIAKHLNHGQFPCCMHVEWGVPKICQNSDSSHSEQDFSPPQFLREGLTNQNNGARYTCLQAFRSLVLSHLWSIWWMAATTAWTCACLFAKPICRWCKICYRYNSLHSPELLSAPTHRPMVSPSDDQTRLETA